MKRIEDALPPEYSFDYAVGELYEGIEEQFQLNLGDTGDVLDVEREVDSNFLHMWSLSGSLAKELASEHEDRDEVHVAIYRGMCFALQVIHEVKSSPISTMDLSSIIPESDEDPRVEILSQTTNYIAERENVGNLLGQYIAKIDPTHRYYHHADTGASLMIMLAERQQAFEILENAVEDLTPDTIVNPH